MARINVKKPPTAFQISYLNDLIWKTYKKTDYIIKSKDRSFWECSSCIGNTKEILKILDILDYLK